MADIEQQARCIRLNVNGEWGSIFLREGIGGEGERQYHWCELTCNTSFGVVGHYWGSMGMPAARFLAKISRDYALDKLWGLNTDVYCESTTRDNLKAHLLQERRSLTSDLSRDTARQLWDELTDADLDNEHSHIVFVYGDDYWSEVYASGCGPKSTIRNPQAEGFWERLWPAFIAELSTGAVPGTLATVKPPRNRRTRLRPDTEHKDCSHG